MKKDQKNMKKAVVDQILLWIVLFISFVGFLFFTIEYSNAIKVKDNTDAIADYTAKMVSLANNNTDIVSGLNNIKDDYFNTIIEDALVCNEDLFTSNYQVIINVYTTLDNGFLSLGSNNVHSKTVVFNEASEYKKECSLTLSFK
jgi:cell division protein FtsB